jgi:glycosyltransferase involved in cell wall biosynthesis
MPKSVALVHSFYSSRVPSGENQVVRMQAEALERTGHRVTLIAAHTDDRERSRLYPIKAGLATSTGLGQSPELALRAARPDVVHVHNLFPNFGRRWTLRWGGPIVTTLHNYRPICPAATLYRDGAVCTECLDRKSSVPSVIHGCYSDSRVRTLPLAASTRFANDPLLRASSRILVLTSRMKSIYETAGVPTEKLQILPNFLPTTDDPAGQGQGGNGWLYVGRLSAEKGIEQLVRDWPAGYRLTVVGSGPLQHKLSAVNSEIDVRGPVSPDEVSRLMRTSKGLVFPSRWFEGLPTVYLEALAAGTPVLAWQPSSVASLVALDGTGLVVQNLDAAIKQADSVFHSLRDHCRKVFEKKYTEGTWLDQIERLYEDVVSASRHHSGGHLA